MELKSIYILIADISGYTKFIKKHRISLLHAEKIVGELMESILDKARTPVIAHEILGDAVSFYAVDSGESGLADDIYSQVLEFFTAFKEKEASLISNCKICNCDACQEIGKLTLKAILHTGEAAFTKVREMQKISGEDIILSHRLLKNTVPSREYILLTSDFVSKCENLDHSALEPLTEECEGIGKVAVYLRNFEEASFVPVPLTRAQKMKNFIQMFSYTMHRRLLGSLLDKDRPVFRNIPYER